MTHSIGQTTYSGCGGKQNHYSASRWLMNGTTSQRQMTLLSESSKLSPCLERGFEVGSLSETIVSVSRPPVSGWIG